MKLTIVSWLFLLSVGGANGQTPVPTSSTPITPAPVTPALVTPAPVTPAPVTPAPVTPAPEAPVSADPTPAPTTSELTLSPTSVTPGPSGATSTPTVSLTEAPSGSTSTPTVAAVTGVPTTTASPTGEFANEYYEEPQQKWSVQLVDTGVPDGPRISKGNAVTVSPDGASVYITLDNGRVDVLSANDGSLRWSYQPEPVAPGWSTMCKSRVTFGESASGKYAVYAVIDIPPFGVFSDYQSRMVAVAHPGNKLMWISDTIPGEIQGEPAITASQRSPGEYIFFTHNQNVTSEEPIGTFSMVTSDSGALRFSEVAGTSRNDPDQANLTLIDTLRLPYAPIGVSHFPSYGRYPGGEGNNNDIFVWSTNADEGKAPNGYTRAFQLPRVFDPVFADSLTTSFLKSNRWNAVASPALTADGINLYFGIRSNRVRAWTGELDFDQGANVAEDLEQDELEPRTPIPFAPSISSAEDKFFIVPSVPIVYALDSDTGDILWSVAGEVLVSAAVSVSVDGALVLVTWVDGTVMAIQQEDGVVAWSIDCNDIDDGPETNCLDTINGASSLAPSGLAFYYGDAMGNVKALQIGDSQNATPAPTEFPINRPTLPPSAYPTSTPTQATAAPTGAPTQISAVSMKPTGANDTLVPTSSPTVSPTATATSTPSVEPVLDTPVPATPLPPSFPPTGPPTENTMTGQPTAAPNDDSGCTQPALAVAALFLSALAIFV